MVAPYDAGHTRYRLHEQELGYKLMRFLEQENRDSKATAGRLAYALSLGFEYPYTLNTFCQKMRTELLDESDLNDLTWRIKLN